MIRAVNVAEADGSSLAEVEALVVCDPDPERAAVCARSLSVRTAVYVGIETDEAADELVRELEAGLRPE